jgi:hypothetical protein
MKFEIPLLMLITSAAFSSTALAGNVRGDADSTPAETTGRSADDDLNMLSLRLSLSDDQKSQILPILVERRQKIRDVLADSTARPRQKMSQMNVILDASDKRINALLTAEQQKTYAIIEQEMRAKMKARHSRTTTTEN